MMESWVFEEGDEGAEREDGKGLVEEDFESLRTDGTSWRTGLEIEEGVPYVKEEAGKDDEKTEKLSNSQEPKAQEELQSIFET